MKISNLAICGDHGDGKRPDRHSPGATLGYGGEAAPQNWSTLHAKFALCASGRISRRSISTDLSRRKPLKLDYKAGVAAIHNHGHTVQINQAGLKGYPRECRTAKLEAWLVMRSQARIQRADQQFSKPIGFANHRAILSTNARSVLQER